MPTTALRLFGLFAFLLASPALAEPMVGPPELLPLPTFSAPTLPEVPPVPSDTPANEARPARASDRYENEARQVSRIEAAAAQNPAAASEAEELKSTLGFERDSRVSSAAQSERRADSWRELTANSESDAQRNFERANAASQSMQSPGLTQAERDDYQRQISFWTKQAVDDSNRAAERRREIPVHVKEAEGHRDAADYLAGLIARLQKVIDNANKTVEDDKIADAVASNNQDADDDTQIEEKASYEIKLQQALGIWRPLKAPEEAMVIVSKNPDGKDPYDLQMFTRGRVWDGKFDPFPAEDAARLRKPRMTFEYRPKASEINPEIPQWAREKIAGTLVWKIDADEIGTAAEPRLSLKFFRGRVRWNEDDKTTALDGDGPPKVYEIGHDIILESQTSAPTLLFVTLANQQHDPGLKDIDAIVQGTPLIVNVVTSSTTARKVGSSLAVDVSGGGKTGKLTLTRQRVTKDRIVGWMSSALGVGEIEPGPRLAALPANGEDVEFRYGDAYQSFPVYVTWVQRALQQYDDEIDNIAPTYGGILSSSASPSSKAEVTTRLRMLSNYQILRNSPDLTDLHKLAIAEAYLGRPHGVQLLNYGTAKLDEINVAHHRDITTSGLDREKWLLSCGPRSASAYRATLQAPDLKGRQATSEEIGDAIQRNALGALGDMDINALTAMQSKDIKWVHTLESECIERVIVRVSTETLQASLKDYAQGLMFGLYEGFAMATGADDVAVAFFETDIYGNKVPQFSLPWWISTVSVAASIADSFEGVVDLGRRNADNAIWKSAASENTRKKSWATALESNTAERMARKYPMTEAVGEASHTYFRRSDGVLGSVPEAADDAITEILTPLSPAQRKQTRLSLLDPADSEITEKIALKPRFPDQIPKTPKAAVVGTGTGASTAVQSNTGVIGWYGKDAKAFGKLDTKLCQIRGEHGCEAVSAMYLLMQEEGIELSESMMHWAIMQQNINRRLKSIGVSPEVAHKEFLLAVTKQQPVGRAGRAYSVAYEDFTRAMHGRTKGYHFDDVAPVLQSRGYQVTAINPRQTGAITVSSLYAALQNGFRIRLGIRHPVTGGGHAVVVQSILRDYSGNLTDVIFFCPAQGGYLKMRADKFQSWIANEFDYPVAYLLKKPEALP